MQVQYILDPEITDSLDLQIKNLLSRCFIKSKALFTKQRYYQEMPAYRYYLCDNSGAMIAHIAVHDKTVLVEGRPYSIAGLAEVCVDPDHRGHGYIKLLLKHIHSELVKQQVDFSVLFGDHCIYNSSGYDDVDNLIMFFGGKWKKVDAMARKISTPWPIELVQLKGPTF